MKLVCLFSVKISFKVLLKSKSITLTNSIFHKNIDFYLLVDLSKKHSTNHIVYQKVFKNILFTNDSMFLFKSRFQRLKSESKDLRDFMALTLTRVYDSSTLSQLHELLALKNNYWLLSTQDCFVFTKFFSNGRSCIKILKNATCNTFKHM